MQRLTITLEVLSGFARLHRLAPDTPLMIGSGTGTAHECAELLLEFREDGTSALTLAPAEASSRAGDATQRMTERQPIVDSAGRGIDAQHAISRALRERSVLNRLAAEMIREQSRQIRARAA